MLGIPLPGQNICAIDGKVKTKQTSKGLALYDMVCVVDGRQHWFIDTASVMARRNRVFGASVHTAYDMCLCRHMLEGCIRHARAQAIA